MLKDELVFDRLAGFSLRTKYESLKKDTAEIEALVRQLTDSLESLNRLQQRYNFEIEFPTRETRSTRASNKRT